MRKHLKNRLWNASVTDKSAVLTDAGTGPDTTEKIRRLVAGPNSV